LARDRDLAVVAVHLVEPVPMLVDGPAGRVRELLGRAPRGPEIRGRAVPDVPATVALGREPHACSVGAVAHRGREGRVDAVARELDAIAPGLAAVGRRSRVHGLWPLWLARAVVDDDQVAVGVLGECGPAVVEVRVARARRARGPEFELVDEDLVPRRA